MNDKELQDQISDLREKLARAEGRAVMMKERNELLEKQWEDSRKREAATAEMVKELLERQRELNVMLNRANIMLNRSHEAIALQRNEFAEIAKSLPEPKKAEAHDKIEKINELFKKTGADEAATEGEHTSQARPVSNTEDSSPNVIDHPTEETNVENRREDWWKKESPHTPEATEAEPVEETFDLSELTDEEVAIDDVKSGRDEFTMEDPEMAEKQVSNSEEKAEEKKASSNGESGLIFPPRRKSWWRRPKAKS